MTSLVCGRWQRPVSGKDDVSRAGRVVSDHANAGHVMGMYIPSSLIQPTTRNFLIGWIESKACAASFLTCSANLALGRHLTTQICALQRLRVNLFLTTTYRPRDKFYRLTFLRPHTDRCQSRGFSGKSGKFHDVSRLTPTPIHCTRVRTESGLSQDRVGTGPDPPPGSASDVSFVWGTVRPVSPGCCKLGLPSQSQGRTSRSTDDVVNVTGASRK